MLDLGTVLPGATIRIPFSTFDKDDGSSITMTNFAAADILIYKDGSTTERASTSGYTATTDFDAKTGKQLITIDLADNTTADFYAAGSEYLVALDAVTVDTVTVGGWVARFRIGVVGAILDTTIATLSSQTSFTLTVGPADNNALIGCTVIIHDAASAIQKAMGFVSAYTGSSKTVTLGYDPGIFTMAAKDNISFIPPSAANLIQINNSTSGVAGFSNAANTITVGTIGAASTTTNIVTSSLTPAAAVTDQFKGLILAFANDTTTTNLRGQKTDITGSTSGGVLTVTPLTTAPVSGDTFVIQ